jgi:hypothetical protein
MNKKVTAIVLASVLASPLMMAKISMASGGGNSLEFEKGFCITGGGIAGSPGFAASGGNSKCLPTDTKGEAEVEYSRKTNTTSGFTKTKLSAEVELKVPVSGSLPATADIVISPLIAPAGPGGIPAAVFGPDIVCSFVNAPTLTPVMKGTPPVLVATKVEFDGSVSQSTDPLALLPTATLSCTPALDPTVPLLKGSLVDVLVDGVAVITDGKLKND